MIRGELVDRGDTSSPSPKTSSKPPVSTSKSALLPSYPIQYKFYIRTFPLDPHSVPNKIHTNDSDNFYCYSCSNKNGNVKGQNLHSHSLRTSAFTETNFLQLGQLRRIKVIFVTVLHYDQ